MCFGVFLLSTLNLYRNLRVNIAKAKRIGLPYEIVRKFKLSLVGNNVADCNSMAS